MKLFVLLLVCFELSLSSAEVIDSLSCDFNNGHHCQYVTPNTNSWRIHSGRYPQVLDGPRSPLPGSQGFLQLVGDSGKLDSPVVHLSGDYCVTLDYFQVGSRNKELTILAESTTFEALKANLPPWDEQYNFLSIPFFANAAERSVIDNWQHYQMSVNVPNDTYHIVIAAESNQDTFEIVALDNLKIEQGACAVQERDSNCNFDNVAQSSDPENTQCDWINIVNAWNATFEDRVRVRTGNGYGYNRDYTTGTMYGGFLEINGHVNPAQLQLSTFTPDMGQHCLSFAARASGPTYRNNFVVFEKAVASGHEHILVEENDPAGHKWTKYNINIDPVVALNVTLQVRGSKLFLDSMRIEPGKCPKPISCKFRDSVCDWKLERWWRIGRGRLTTPVDHDDTDYPHNYLYHDMTFRDVQARRYIVSETTNGGGLHCFKFVYKAQNTTNIHVATRFGFLDHPEFYELPEHQSESDGEWTVGYRDIKEHDKFQIRLSLENEGRWGRDVEIFKLREVELLDGHCGQVVPPPQFTPVQFHCYQTGHYITMYRSCDGVIDCPMGEDEGAQCSGGHECSNGGIPCRRRGHKFCLTDTQLMCNGVKDCDDSIDEDPRMCNRDTFCNNYCLNGGVCQHDSFNCACEAGFSGKRCA